MEEFCIKKRSSGATTRMPTLPAQRSCVEVYITEAVYVHKLEIRMDEVV